MVVVSDRTPCMESWRRIPAEDAGGEGLLEKGGGVFGERNV